MSPSRPAGGRIALEKGEGREDDEKFSRGKSQNVGLRIEIHHTYPPPQLTPKDRVSKKSFFEVASCQKSFSTPKRFEFNDCYHELFAVLCQFHRFALLPLSPLRQLPLRYSSVQKFGS